VLRPSTGAILAIANSAGSGDTALTGGLAPGSTFKIITSAALLNYGYVSLYTPIACPLVVTVQSVNYHNSTDSTGKNEESLPVGTPFITDFAQSCNNAFTPFYKQLEGGKLAHTASTYFGLDQSWDLGLGSNSYFHIPTDSSGAELAQENFGQGKIVASPLAMASVASTVGTGSFHQPYLVDGLTKATATALPSGTDSNLKTLMRAVVISGTAAGVFSGVGTVYAKTGTADADANKDGKPNSWMVVYDPARDIAVGVVVQDSGFGAIYAGPEAQYVLSHL
jgi:cell division protein FtsI/penicillin-binding protein 2